MTQVFYHYSELEEHHAGMWRRTSVGERDGLIDAAADLMRQPTEFLEAMLSALRGWPKSMEAAFSTPMLNRRAYMGHAGCCVAVNAPEDLTRLAWHMLSPEEQAAANAAADQVIAQYQRPVGAQSGMFDA